MDAARTGPQPARNLTATGNANQSGALSANLTPRSVSFLSAGNTVSELRSTSPRAGAGGEQVLNTQASFARIRGAQLEAAEDFQEGVLSDPATRGRFEGLEPLDQAKFRSVYGRLSPDELPQQAELMESGRESLVDILNSDKLLDQDKDGRTLLDNLNMTSNQTARENDDVLDGRVVTAELAKQIADPGTIHQNNRNSCAPTSIEYFHAKDQPADYARVVRGLTSPEGKAELHNGEVMERDRFNLNKDSSTRSNASRIYQSSALEHINAGFDYRNDIDQHVYVFDEGDPNNLDDDVAAPTGDTGVMEDEGKRLSEALLGGGFEYRKGPANSDQDGTLYKSKFEDGSQTWQTDMQNSLDNERPVMASLQWGNNGSSNHVLAVTGMDDQHVYMRNPWGQEEDADPSRGPSRELITTLPGGQASDTGGIRMTREDFEAHLSAYHFGT